LTSNFFLIHPSRIISLPPASLLFSDMAIVDPFVKTGIGFI
jgi:hypothetical protein